MTRLMLLLAALLILGGCNKPAPRLNAPPHGEANETVESQGTLVYMNDTALLANMTISDMHFLPHRAQLNGNGLERLSRLAQLMQAYGGTIRYNTDETDETLLARRTDAVMQFLRETGLTTTSETLTRDLPGGKGMSATEAVLIKTHEATYNPKAKSGSASGGASGGNGSTSFGGSQTSPK